MNDHPDTHRIRLAGPWQTTDAAGEKRVQLPFRPTGSAERLIVSRSFNGSPGMLAADTVWVKIAYEGTPPTAEVNQSPVTPEGSATPQTLILNVTKLLKPSNRLILNCGSDQTNQVTDVCLLISEQPSC